MTIIYDPLAIKIAQISSSLFPPLKEMIKTIEADYNDAKKSLKPLIIYYENEYGT